MEKKQDYIVVNIPTSYTYSPPYSPPYNVPSRPSYSLQPTIYNNSLPIIQTDIPYNYIKPSYNNLTYRRRVINKPIYNHTIYDKKDNIITLKNNDTQCYINYSSNFDSINTGNDDITGNDDNTGNADNYENADNYYKKSTLTKCTTLIKNFIGQQNIINDDTQFINV